MPYNLTSSRELTQPWHESSPWGDSDQCVAYILYRASTSAVLPYVCWYSFYLPTEGWMAESTPSQVGLGVAIEPRTCHMMVHCSINWAIPADSYSIIFLPTIFISNQHIIVTGILGLNKKEFFLFIELMATQNWKTSLNGLCCQAW